MGRVKPWHEQEEFWETACFMLFPESRWAETPGEVSRLISIMDLKPGERVLDLCCGPGRHALELARRGMRVTGVDRTAAYVDMAREKARSEGLDVEFVCGDMRSFRRPESFDAVLNLFTSFGYFDDQAEDRRVLQNVHASLVPGGRLLMDMMGKEVLARAFRERDWYRMGEAVVLEERRLSRDWGWIDTRWTLIRGGSMTELTLSHRLYSAAELESLLAECGFEQVRAYGDLAGRPYDHAAQRLVVVAKRPCRVETETGG